MDWKQTITKAINYMENNLTNNISVEDVCSEAYISSSHFQRVFSVVTDISIGDYIRNRRLSLAGLDLLLTNDKVIDVAMKYQYDTSESFSKAFTRFHGFPPSVVKKHGESLKCFDPITINIFIQGGFNMSRKIMENDKGVRLIREKFEYKHVGKLRFIGLDLANGPSEAASSVQGTIDYLSPLLYSFMNEYDVEATKYGYCFLMHHNGREWNETEILIGGYFFKEDTPVPESCIYYDVPTINIGYGIYSGDESFGGDTFDAYEFTRDQILGDKIEIPYPQAYWTAVQFIDGEPKKGQYRFGYMFGVGELK